MDKVQNLADGMIQIDSVVVRESKDGRNFKECDMRAVEVKTIKNPLTGKEVQMVSPIRAPKMIVWERDHDSIGGKPNPEYPSCVKNAVKMGKVVTRNVEEYPITKMVKEEGSEELVEKTTLHSTYSCPVFGNTQDEDGFNQAIIREFKRRDKVIVNELPTQEPAIETIVEKEIVVGELAVEEEDTAI